MAKHKFDKNINLTLTAMTYDYTRHQIKNDQPGSHDFRRFLHQFWTDFLENFAEAIFY